MQKFYSTKIIIGLNEDYGKMRTVYMVLNLNKESLYNNVGKF